MKVDVKAYVVLVEYDEGMYSWAIGPFDSLGEAQRAQEVACAQRIDLTVWIEPVFSNLTTVLERVAALNKERQG